MNSIQILIGSFAAALGIYYAGIGFAAIKYLRNAAQTDKAVGWTLWWCLDVDRYTKDGQRLCKRGQLAALASITLWIAVHAVKWL